MTVLLAPVVSEKGTFIADKYEQVIFRVMQNATKPEIKAAVELMFKVEVESVQIANVKGKKKRFGRIMGRRRELEEGLRVPEAGPGNQLRGGGLNMPLVKVKPTSPGRRVARQGRQRRACTRARRSRRSSRARSAARAATTTATSRCATRAAATSSTTGIVDFKRNKDGIAAKVERLEYDPNRSAQHRAAAVRRRRAPLHHRAARRRRRRAADVGRRSADQAGQHAAAAQHPGRHDDPLHRDAAGQGRADRALGRRRACSCSRAKASTRSCGCARARSARCTSIAARRSAKSATRSTACARSARPVRSAGAASARRCAASR